MIKLYTHSRKPLERSRFKDVHNEGPRGRLVWLSYRNKTSQGCFKSQRNSHSHTQRDYSKAHTERDKETTKREKEERDRRLWSMIIGSAT